MRCHNKESLANLKSMTLAQLEQAYVAHGRNSTRLATTLGLSRCAVENKMRHTGIITRTPSEFVREHNLSKNSVPLTDGQHALILGSLLGDSCLYTSTSGGLGIRFCHSVAQLGYLLHKQQAFSGRASKLYEVPLNNFRSRRWSFTFTSTPCLEPYIDLCKSQGPLRPKTVTEEWASRLTLESISYWFEDDGYIVVSNPRTNCTIAGFCTNSFSKIECEILAEVLQNFGLTVRLVSSGRNKDQFILLSRWSDETRHFLGKLTCHHPCLHYKFRTALQ